jgi:hypothetical protein
MSKFTDNSHCAGVPANFVSVFVPLEHSPSLFLSAHGKVVGHAAILGKRPRNSFRGLAFFAI